MDIVSGRRQIAVALSIATLVILAAMYVAPRPSPLRPNLPETLSDSEFRNLIDESSEPGGYFRSDNFVSNESAFQHVIPRLKQQMKPGGVYLGVGPEQNFTYIAALRPHLALITDIRRQNMMLHLMYKALFELSGTRSEFLSRLFARPIPGWLTKTEKVERLFELIGNVQPDRELARENLASILRQLHERHGFVLTPEDSKSIEFV